MNVLNSLLNVVTGMVLIGIMLFNYNTMKFDFYFLIYMLGAMSILYGLLGLFLELASGSNK